MKIKCYAFCFFFDFLKFLGDAKLNFFRFLKKKQNNILGFFEKKQKNILCFLKKFKKIFQEKFWENLGDENQKHLGKKKTKLINFLENLSDAD